jgi:hypothetical protein
MPFDIAQISATQPPAGAMPAARTANPQPGAFDAVLSARQAALDAIPASPPPEVLDATGVAARAYDRLAAAGRQLHFETNAQTGHLSVQVLDSKNNVLGTVSASKLLELAAGGSLD